MKKFFSFIIISIFIIAISNYKTSNCSAAVKSNVIDFDEDGFAFHKYNSEYIIDSREIIKANCQENVYLFTLTSWGESLIYEYDIIPAKNELPVIAQSLYSKLDPQVVDTYPELPLICLLIKNNGHPYVVSINKNGDLNNTDIYPYIRYELDGQKHQLKDFTTKKVLVDFDKKGSVRYEGFDYDYSAADGYVYLGKEKDSQYYIREIEYTGSSPYRVDFATELESSFDHTIDLLSGDLNMDGTVDLSDLTILSLKLIGDREITPLQLKISDLDHDNNLTLADLARLQQYLSKKIESL